MMLTLAETKRTFWICFIFTLIFVILGIISLLKCFTSTLGFLGAVWFLQLFLMLLFAYYGIIYYPCNEVLIYILFLLGLLFATMWVFGLVNKNLMFSNLSLVVALIFTICLIYLSPYKVQVLGVLSILIWLFLFYYINLCSNNVFTVK